MAGREPCTEAGRVPPFGVEAAWASASSPVPVLERAVNKNVSLKLREFFLFTFLNKQVR